MKQSPTNELTGRILNHLFPTYGFPWRQNTAGMPVRRAGQVVAVKSSGKTGVPDICCVLKGGIFLGIEVKTGKDRMRPEQEGFRDSIHHVGGYYIVVHTFEDFIQKLSTVLQEINSRVIFKP